MLSSKKKSVIEDDDDDFDNILDDVLTQGEPEANKRPATAVAAGNFNSRKESLWSAGGPNARNNNAGSGLKYGAADNNDLDDLEDDDEDGLGLENRLSANKASSHQRSNDELLE